MFKFSGKLADTATSTRRAATAGRHVDIAEPSQIGSAFAKPTSLGVLEGLLPTKNLKKMREIYRDMYLHDPICGAVIDMISNLPFGPFSLSGVPDTSMLLTYLKSCESIRLQSLLPALTSDYMVNGAFLGVLNYDPSEKIFDSVSPQDINNAELEFIPIFGNTPLVTLVFPQGYASFMSRTGDPRVQKALKWVPKALQEAMKKGRLDLNTENTLFVPRRSSSYDFVGTSILQRLAPIFLMEKALMRGTIELAYRRQRAILHVVVGDEDWTPSQTDLDSVATLFMNADRDPVGSIIATRPGIQVNDIQPGGEFWRSDSISDQMTSLKLKALGVGESFLGTDASVNSVENAMNVFTRQLEAFRTLITHDVLYNKIFPLVAATNNFVRDSDDSGYKSYAMFKDESTGHMSVLSSGTAAGRIAEEDIDASKYHIPTVTWHTSLNGGMSGSDRLEMLKNLSAVGVPVPLRILAATAGLSLADIMNGKDEDLQMRKELKAYNKLIQKDMQSADGGGEGGDFASSLLHGGMPKTKSILSRDFGDLNDRLTPSLDGRGRRQVKTARYQQQMDEQINRRINEAATRLEVP